MRGNLPLGRMLDASDKRHGRQLADASALSSRLAEVNDRRPIEINSISLHAYPTTAQLICTHTHTYSLISQLLANLFGVSIFLGLSRYLLAATIS